MWSWIFVLITIICYPILYGSFINQAANTKSGIAFFGVYFAGIMILAFFMVQLLIKDHCNSLTGQIGNILKIISVSWLLIFLVLWILLTFVFPGWKAPFSNTIGYAFVHMYNLKGVVSKIQTMQKLDNFDINDVTPETFNQFCATAPALDSNQDLKANLRKIIVVKDSVSISLWFLLTGLFVILVTQNYISGQTCERTLEESIKLHEDYEKKVAAGEHKRSGDPDSKHASEQAVYTV
jgi:hypothetical protein